MYTTNLPPLSKAELLAKLEACRELAKTDQEAAHGDADEWLLRYINDDEVTEAFYAIPKWYA